MSCSWAASRAPAICRAIASTVANGNEVRWPSFGERLAFDQLEDERLDPVVVLEAVNRADVWVVQRGECLGLAPNRARRSRSYVNSRAAS